MHRIFLKYRVIYVDFETYNAGDIEAKSDIEGLFLR